MVDEHIELVDIPPERVSPGGRAIRDEIFGSENQHLLPDQGNVADRDWGTVTEDKSSSRTDVSSGTSAPNRGFKTMLLHIFKIVGMAFVFMICLFAIKYMPSKWMGLSSSSALMLRQHRNSTNFVHLVSFVPLLRVLMPMSKDCTIPP